MVPRQAIPSIGWRRWSKALFLFIVLLFLGVNALVWMHTWTLTHFVDPNEPLYDVAVVAALPLQERVKLLVSGIPIPRPENRVTPDAVGFPYEVHTIALPGDEALEAWELPHPQPHGIALLFHGYIGSKDDLFEPARVLHEMGYAIFMVDFRGSGGSSGSTTTLGVREAEDVAAATAYVHHIWPDQRILLYGTSMGSAAILRAIQYEGVQPEAIIIETPFDRMINAVRVRISLLGMPTFPAAHLVIFWGGVQHGFNGFAHNPADHAQSVTCPTLVLGGEQDGLAPPAQVEAVFEHLAGHKQLIIVPQAGHTLLINQTPEVQQQVAAFLRFVEETY